MPRLLRKSVLPLIPSKLYSRPQSETPYFDFYEIAILTRLMSTQ